MLIREVVERQKRVKNIFTQITNKHHTVFSDHKNMTLRLPMVGN